MLLIKDKQSVSMHVVTGHTALGVSEVKDALAYSLDEPLKGVVFHGWTALGSGMTKQLLANSKFDLNKLI